jgi:hypothetical protein
MAVIEGGVSAALAGVAAENANGLHVIAKPTAFGALGQYTYGGFTGILAAALGANSEIFQYRWTHASNLAVIRKVRISACVSTTFFAAGVPVQIDLVKATGWTVAGTGGTAITPAALLKRRTSMGSTLVASGDIRISTTAALGAGTKTLETLALSSIAAPGPITASLNGQIIPPGTVLWQAEVGDGEHPLVLAQNEGFVIRSVAVPATGTWTVAVNVDWAEVTAY